MNPDDINFKSLLDCSETSLGSVDYWLFDKNFNQLAVIDTNVEFCGSPNA